MSYLHCHGCGWGQDDFWSKTYNPLRSLVNLWEKQLLADNLDKLKDFDAWDDNGNHYIEQKSIREVIASAVENAAKTIRDMTYRTREDFISANNPVCPKCGADDWDID